MSTEKCLFFCVINGKFCDHFADILDKNLCHQTAFLMANL